MIARSRDEIPTLSGFVLRGTPYADLPEFLRTTAAERGPIVRFHFPWTDLYLVNDPATIERVLVSDATSFRKGRGTRRLRRLLGNGLLTAERPDHLPHRRLVQPAFARARFAAYAEVMVSATRACVDRWRDGETIDLERETSGLALEIVARTLFGTTLRAQTDAISHALDEALATFPASMLPLSELWDALPLPVVLRFKRAKRSLDAVVAALIAEHRAGGGGEGDVLSLLLASADPAAGDEPVRDEVLTLLLAGHETVANALAWTLLSLGRAPGAAAAVQAEVDAVLGERLPSHDDAARLPQVRAALAEGLRLFPPAWITGRSALRPLRVGPLSLRRGDTILVSQYVTQRDARYFPDPLRFDPARFAPGAPAVPRFAYFPFGAGTRVCIGEAFAMLEGTLALATIVQRLTLEPEAAPLPALQPYVTLRPIGPVRARVRSRKRDV